MRVVSDEALAALDSGRYAVRHLVRVDVPGEDPLGLWDDLGTLEVDGCVYHGAPGKFTLTPSVSSQDMSVRNLDIILPGLDNDAINLITESAWHQAPVLVQRAIIGIETPTVFHLLREFSGFLDQVFRRESVGGELSLTFRCESASRENARRGTRTRSDADQRQRDSTDGFYSFATSAINTQITWGKSGSPQNPTRSVAVSSIR